MLSPGETLKIGYVSGQSRRLNERTIDEQWVRYLGEYCEMVQIPPFGFIKLFGGSVEKWVSGLPGSLPDLSAALANMSERYNVKMIYMNLPALIPYLLMARNDAAIDLGLLFLAHSAGSESWLKQWIAIAPYLSEKDVLLASSSSCKEALMRISGRYAQADHIPLCIAMRGGASNKRKQADRTERRILSIGRIEDVKNIHVLLECFNAIRRMVPDARLIVAGEYTGSSDEQIDGYRTLLNETMDRLNLHSGVEFAGPVEGGRKDELFRQSDVLINLSTDPGETFGFNLIEAKTWGVPVVCTNWDGFREIVRHGVDGFLVDCPWEGELPLIDRDQAAAFTAKLLLDPEMRQAFSSNALREAHQYDYKRICPIIVDKVRHSRSATVVSSPQVAPGWTISPADVPSLYRLEYLRHIPWIGEPLLSPALNSRSSTPYLDWIRLAKPVIGHFAGRVDYAKL